MKSSRVPIIVLLVAVGAIAGLRMYWDSPAREIVPWRADLQTAIAEAGRTHKPIFLDFSASWCEPCKAMRGTTWASGDVKNALDAYVPVQIDIDANADLARKFSVDSIPCFFVCDEYGSPKRGTGGLMSPDAMIAWLRSN